MVFLFVSISEAYKNTCVHSYVCECLEIHFIKLTMSLNTLCWIFHLRKLLRYPERQFPCVLKKGKKEGREEGRKEGERKEEGRKKEKRERKEGRKEGWLIHSLLGRVWWGYSKLCTTLSNPLWAYNYLKIVFQSSINNYSNNSTQKVFLEGSSGITSVQAPSAMPSRGWHVISVDWMRRCVTQHSVNVILTSFLTGGDAYHIHQVSGEILPLKFLE